METYMDIDIQIQIELNFDMEMEIEYDPEVGAYEYREATARPDAEGKLKDVEEYIEDVDLEEMKKYTYDE